MGIRNLGCRPLQHRLRAALLAFHKGESGALIVFGIVLFTVMLMLGGMAVDVMRHERLRTELQNTLDRSVLAAASLKQTLNPEDVVVDYFTKAGLAEYLTLAEADEGLNYRIVNARAEAESHPFFMHLLGIDNFPAAAASSAEQRISNVEIVLVLDVSGSMEGDKIANLKSAAKEFVDTVLGDGGSDHVSIAIVPYAAGVNLPESLRTKYNATYQHGISQVNCLQISSALYANSGISRTLELPMVAYADSESGTVRGSSSTQNMYVSETSTSESSGATPLVRPCGTNSPPAGVTHENNMVRLPSNDPVQIKAWIDGLDSDNGTAIMAGMKWGLALIDPSARTVYEDLIGEAAIPAEFTGRPYDYNQDDTMKVIVLMTDGENTTHMTVSDAFKTGLSPIYLSEGDGKYSIYLDGTLPAAAGGNRYWVPHLVPTNATAMATGYQAGPWDGVGVDVEGDARVVRQLNWEEVWQRQRVRWVAWQLYARGYGGSDGATRYARYSTWVEAMRPSSGQVNHSVSAMDTALQQSCTLARNSGVIVFGIAFEAPSNGEAQISQCATSLAHYYNATGLEIEDAFRNIASQISYLRLTQ